MARKKRTKAKTPSRVSTRKRTRTAKGIYYDEHFDDVNAVEENKEGATEVVEVTVETSGSSSKSQTGVLDACGEATPAVLNGATPTMPDTTAPSTRKIDPLGATPIGVVHGNNTVSLKRELEQVLTPTLSAVKCVETSSGSFKFHESVITVNTNIVKEIDFNNSQEDAARKRW